MIRKTVALLGILCGLTFASSAQTTNSIRVMWDRNPESDIASYLVYYKTPSTPLGVVNAGTNNIAVIPISPGGVYEIYVTARNVSGIESDGSNKIRYQMLYVNGNALPTPLILGDFNTTNNFSGFSLLTSTTNGTVTGTVPRITYTSSNSARRDTLVYRSPEIASGTNIVNYYGFQKIAPPILRSLTTE